MKKLYAYDSDFGPFYICQLADGTYALYNNQLFNRAVGSFASPERAAMELAESTALTLAAGSGYPGSGIPCALREWDKLL